MSHHATPEKGDLGVKDRRTSTFLFKWTEKASQVSVVIWEAGIQTQPRKVKLPGGDYWDGFSYQKLVELENHQDKVFYKFEVDGLWTVNPDYSQEQVAWRENRVPSMCNVITHKELQIAAGLWHSVHSTTPTSMAPGTRYPPPLLGRLSSQTPISPLSQNMPSSEPRMQSSVSSKSPNRATGEETKVSGISFTPKRGKVLEHRIPGGDQEIFVMSGDEVLILDDRGEWWYVECSGSGTKGLVPKDYIRMIDQTLGIANFSESEQSIGQTTTGEAILDSGPSTRRGYQSFAAVAEQTFQPCDSNLPRETNNMEKHKRLELIEGNSTESIDSSGPFIEQNGKPTSSHSKIRALINILRKDVAEARAGAATIACERDTLAEEVNRLQDIILGGRQLAGTPESGTSLPTADHKSYPYKRLDFDDYEIRLLDLSWDYSEYSALKCTIEHVSLIDPGSYIALSYCWGDPTVTEKITLDGLEIDVTASLASALKAVHKHYILTGNGIRVWADALCIDQGNTEERSHQVRSMRQIYSKASEVVCWVGPDEGPGLSKAVNFWGGGGSRRNRGDDVDDEDKREAFNSFENESWVLLEQFFSQPYWQRVWIIQEITVASKATVFFGDFYMPWDTVAQLLRTLQTESCLPGRPSERAFLNAVHLLEFRHRFVNKRLDLMDALQMTRRALATDPRDKIFALLGLCHDGPLFVPIPNYKQPLEIILADMTKAMMSMNRSLDLMCIRGTASPQIDKPNLPTWSPDWVSVWSGPMTVQEADFPHWKRSYDFNPVLEGSNHRLIKVRGRFISKITRLCSSINSDGKIEIPQVRPPWIPATSSLNQHNDRLRNPTHSELELRDFLWGTVTMSSSPTELTRSCFSTLWRPEGRGLVHNIALISWIDENAWFKVGPWTLREWSQIISRNIVRTDQPGITLQVNRRVSWETDPKANLDELLAFIETLDKILGSGMKLAVLRGDQSLGMVHPRAMEQDEIYLLHGCTLPVVLRPMEDEDGTKQYHVIGAAYTLGTDPNSAYYLGTRNNFDLLDWKSKDTRILTLA